MKRFWQIWRDVAVVFFVVGIGLAAFIGLLPLNSTAAILFLALFIITLFAAAVFNGGRL